MVLKLETIRLHNFKSFKGTHIVDNLDNHFTAIVGPNGSGKSNIIDSILFVLGYRAKKMRHAMLKDLIYAGESECLVELIFNEFKVSRSLKGKITEDLKPNKISVDENHLLKNCTSKYFLNDKEIQTAELFEFLKSNGIDLDNNRFLILQGEIENISLMGPLDLLSYIEDCIGTSEFKAGIEETELEIKSKDEEYEVITNNLKFIETDFMFKKGKRDEKVDFLKFKKESLVLKHKIIKIKGEICRRKELTFANEKECALKALDSLQKRNKQFLKSIQSLEAQIDSLDLKKREDGLLKIKREYQRIQRENKNIELKRGKLVDDIKKTKSEISEAEINMKNWDEESKVLNKQIKTNGNDLKKLYNEKSALVEKLSHFGAVNQYEKIKEKNQALIVDLMNKRSTIDREINEIACLRSKIENLEKIKAGNLSVDSNQKGILIKEIERIKEDLRLTNIEILNRRRRADEFKSIEIGYQREKEVLEALKNIQGVHGFLKSLGSVQSGYDVAVEASTRAFNSIVVESTSVAEECIGVINKKKLNRTTFIILDRLADTPKSDETIALGEYLYKKINCDKKYIKAFYFALKDTIVVKTLEDAKSLAFGRIRRRVVTVDGKLLEKSGIMSGGKAFKKLKSVNELEGIYKNIQAIYENKTKELEEIRANEMEILNYQKNIQMLEKLKEETDFKEKRLDVKELERINLMIDNAKTEIAKYKGLSETDEISYISNELRTINGKIDYIEKENQKFEMRLASAPNADFESLVRDLKRQEKELGAINTPAAFDVSEMEEAEREYKEILEEFKKKQEEINSLREKMGGDYHEEAECRAKLEEVNDGLSDCEKIKGNCIRKEKDVLHEHKMIINLLEDSEKNEEDFIDPELFFEMTDSELKAKSKELIEELNIKETENFNRLKKTSAGALASNDEDVLEDVELYKMIFSEYEASKQKYESAKSSSEYLKAKIDTLKKDLESKKSERYKRFMEGFNSINRNLKDIFKTITFGGNAELDLQDFLNPFSEGIVLSIMPPKKSWKQISNLSGGEKTLSSLSLIFALHKYRPSSFYIMDEIDAALDHKNVSIISQYLSRIRSQFIVISLRNDMFEMANTLLGVYKVKDVSRVLMLTV